MLFALRPNFDEASRTSQKVKQACFRICSYVANWKKIMR